MRRLLPCLSLLLALPALAAGPGDHVVARIAGEPITLDEVDASGEAQLMLLKDQLFWARIDAAERLVARRLIEIEAKAKGQSVSTYLEEEVQSKVSEPTDADVEAFWKENPNAAPPEQRAGLRESVLAYLSRERARPVREALVERLRAKHAPGLSLDLPSARMEIDFASAPAKGPQDAPVTLAAFTDYECPGCASLVQVLDYLEQNFGSNLRIVHLDFPNDAHERADEAAVAARCAGRFGKYWEYHDRLFTDTKDLSEQRLTAIAGELGLDEQGFAECRADPSVAAEVNADKELGKSIGITGTPHVVLNGLSLKGGLDGQTLAQLVAMELDRLQVPAPDETGRSGQ